MDILKIDSQLCFKVYSASKSIIRFYNPLLKKLNLTYPQYLVMLVIWENKSICFNNLSCILRMKTGTLTPIISKLEESGYIKRVKDEADDRKINIVITDLGEALKGEAISIPDKIACSLNLSNEEYIHYMKEFNDFLNKLEKIEKYCE